MIFYYVDVIFFKKKKIDRFFDFFDFPKTNKEKPLFNFTYVNILELYLYKCKLELYKIKIGNFSRQYFLCFTITAHLKCLICSHNYEWSTTSELSALYIVVAQSTVFSVFSLSDSTWWTSKIYLVYLL